MKRFFVKRPPDFTVGDPDDPYMRRWWLIPRNRWCGCYLHHIRRSDPGLDLHDHPYHNVSIVLRGGYDEQLADGRIKRRKAWHVIPRRARTLHRLMVRPGESAWTLFITGPRMREWGFMTPDGWRPWHEVTKPEQQGVRR